MAKKPTKEDRRRWRLATYGISQGGYEEMLEGQGGRCAICRRSVSEFDKKLAIDHCHDDGTVRGLLCGPCNSGLGMFQDDIKLIYKAYEYLMIHDGLIEKPNLTRRPKDSHHGRILQAAGMD